MICYLIWFLDYQYFFFRYIVLYWGPWDVLWPTFIHVIQKEETRTLRFWKTELYLSNFFEERKKLFFSSEMRSLIFLLLQKNNFIVWYYTGRLG